MTHLVPIAIVDGASGALVARADLDPARLPEVHAKLRIDGRAWLVIDVCDSAPNPGVRLVVREVSDLTLDDLRYRVPTLSGDLPSLSSERRAGSVLDLSEDTWRQVELIACSQHAAIEASLGAIRQVRTHARIEPNGWRRCHVRREIPLPIAPWTLALRAVKDAYEAPFVYDGLAYPGVSALAQGGFALQLRSTILLYGLADEGGVTTLALLGWGNHQRAADVDALATLARTAELDLVDWARARRVPPEQFAAYFAARAGVQE